MSTKQPHQSSDDVKKFIDDVAVEDNGEDDDKEEDPDQSEPSSSYS